VADLAFLLGQYAFAASTYRLAAGDYLNANNNKWYAGAEVSSRRAARARRRRCAAPRAAFPRPLPASAARGTFTPPPTSPAPPLPSLPRPCQEMIGLCCILDAGEAADPLKYFSRAYEGYTKVPGKVARMLATRTMLLAAAYLAGAGRHQVRGGCGGCWGAVQGAAGALQRGPLPPARLGPSAAPPLHGDRSTRRPPPPRTPTPPRPPPPRRPPTTC
jgi:hypothetical protein